MEEKGKKKEGGEEGGEGLKEAEVIASHMPREGRHLHIYKFAALQNSCREVFSVGDSGK